MHWIESHQAWFWWFAAASVIMLIASPLVVGWLVLRLPADYFAWPRRRHLAYWDQHWTLRLAIGVMKNAIGLALVAAGIVMLFVPGQGLLTIVVGLMLVDFPGKYGFERWLVTRKTVWRSINWLRKRARCEPLVRPE